MEELKKEMETEVMSKIPTPLTMGYNSYNWIDSVKECNNFFYNELNTVSANKEKAETFWIRTLASIFVLIFLFNLGFIYVSVKRIQQEMKLLNQLNSTLEHKNQTLEKFTYKTFHHFKEPLRNISGFLHLLKKNHAPKLDKESLEFIDHAMNSTRQMEKEIQEARYEVLQNPQDKPTA